MATRVSLSRKSDTPFLAFFTLLFVGVTVLAFVDRVALGVLCLLLISPFIYFFVIRSLPVLGTEAVITEDELLLERKGVTMWGLRFQDLTRASVLQPGSPVKWIEFELRDGTCRALGSFLGGQQQRQLYAAISSRLPAGVTLDVVAAKYRPSRSSYLVRGSILLCIGVPVLAYALIQAKAQIGGEAMSTSAGFLASLALGSFVAISIGALELLGFAHWKDKAMRHPMPIDIRLNLLTALTNQDSTTRRFAYPERYRSKNLKQEVTLSYVLLGFMFLVMSGLLVAALLNPPPGRPVTLQQALALGGLNLGVWVFLTRVTVLWHRRMRRTYDNIQSQILLEGGRLFILRDGERWPAEIVSSPKLTLATRDSGGLNRAEMVVEARGEKHWFDPSSMRVVE